MSQAKIIAGGIPWLPWQAGVIVIVATTVKSVTIRGIVMVS